MEKLHEKCEPANALVPTKSDIICSESRVFMDWAPESFLSEFNLPGHVQKKARGMSHVPASS